MSDSTSRTDVGQSDVSFLLGRPHAELVRWLNCCPSSGHMTAWSVRLGCFVIGATRCKRWTCPHCGPRRVANLTQRIVDARPNKLMTLTTWTKAYPSPRSAYDRTRRQVSKVVLAIRKAGIPFEYLRVLEITERGWPHYHLIVRGGFVDWHWLRSTWQRLTGSHVVDIRPLNGAAHTARYVAKYLHKQRAIPWTDRRVSWSRGFFADEGEDKPPPLELIDVVVRGGRPDQELSYWRPGMVLTRVGPDMWATGPVDRRTAD